MVLAQVLSKARIRESLRTVPPGDISTLFPCHHVPGMGREPRQVLPEVLKQDYPSFEVVVSTTVNLIKPMMCWVS